MVLFLLLFMRVFVATGRANNSRTLQINFLERHKEPSLDVLLKHMPEVEALRFLHDVADVCHLERKLKKNFPDGTVVEEVPLCVFVGDMMRLGILWKNTVFLHTHKTILSPAHTSGMRSVYSPSTSIEKVWPRYYGV